MSNRNTPPKPTSTQVKGAASRKGGGTRILASAVVTTADTDVLAEDLYNEPLRSRNNLLNDVDEWVFFFNSNQSFVKELIALLNNSPTLRRIVTDKSTMACGDGFIVQKRTLTLLVALRKIASILGLSESELERLENYLGNVNLNGESLLEVYYKLAYDLFAFGNCFAELVRVNGSNKKFYIYHVPVYMVAVKKADTTMLIKTYGICENWAEQPGAGGVNIVANPSQDVRELPVYPRFTTGAPDQRSILHVKEYAPGYFYWGLPTWIAAKHYAELEYRIPKYNIAKFKNGYVPSSIVQFFGNVSKADAEKVVGDFKKSFTDTGQHHKVFIQVLRDQALKANVQVLEDNSQGNYLELQQLAAQMIVTSANYTMSLAGQAQAGKLGTNEQVRRELEFVNATAIKPAQNKLLSKIINPFLKEAGEHLGQAWKGWSLSVSNFMPISFMGDVDVNAVLTTNEKREVLGFDPLDEEGMKELKGTPIVTPNTAIPSNVNNGTGSN
ncbi:MAG: phage portal protein [Richelia sp. SL_2_1]|nr:phage portal protein [Richelia sp. SL_2_1]